MDNSKNSQTTTVRPDVRRDKYERKEVWKNVSWHAGNGKIRKGKSHRAQSDSQPLGKLLQHSLDVMRPVLIELGRNGAGDLCRKTTFEGGRRGQGVRTPRYLGR